MAQLLLRIINKQNGCSKNIKLLNFIFSDCFEAKACGKFAIDMYVHKFY